MEEEEPGRFEQHVASLAAQYRESDKSVGEEFTRHRAELQKRGRQGGYRWNRSEERAAAVERLSLADVQDFFAEEVTRQSKYSQRGERRCKLPCASAAVLTKTDAFACGAAVHHCPCSKYRLSSSMMARITLHPTHLLAVPQFAPDSRAGLSVRVSHGSAAPPPGTAPGDPRLPPYVALVFWPRCVLCMRVHRHRYMRPPPRVSSVHCAGQP